MSTTIDIDELPVATEAGQGRAATIAVPPAPSNRRQFVRNVVQGAAFVGLAGLTLFRSPRRAGAENPPWNEFTSCGPYDPGDGHPCHDNMCVGTSLELMDNSFCTTDCAQVDPLNPYQWHKNRTYGSVSYRDYPGDICGAGDGQPPRDAWRWSVGPCGFCNPSVYRCHDGEKRTSPTGEWQFTICEGLATCSGAPVSC
jgi:hypothetical protein